MRGKTTLFAVLLVLGLAVTGPRLLWAGEHGGQEHGGHEHGGSASAAKAEHGGKAMEGSHGHEDTSAVLKEAARVLEKEGYAELAKKVKAIANK